MRHVLLRRRPETGLLGGMMEVPSGPWEATPEFRDDPPAVTVPASGLPEPAPSAVWSELAPRHERLPGHAPNGDDALLVALAGDLQQAVTALHISDIQADQFGQTRGQHVCGDPRQPIAQFAKAGRTGVQLAQDKQCPAVAQEVKRQRNRTVQRVRFCTRHALLLTQCKGGRKTRSAP